MKLYRSISLQDRIKNAITKLGIDPESIVSITDLSRVRISDDMRYSDVLRCGLIRGFMIDYGGYSHSYYFICDNGFAIEFKNWFITDEYTPKHHNLYRIMMLYNMGLTQEAIAKALNVSSSTIACRLKIIKQILEISTMPDMDLEDTTKVIRYDDNHQIRFSELSNRLQKLIDKYERRYEDETSEEEDDDKVDEDDDKVDVDVDETPTASNSCEAMYMED